MLLLVRSRVAPRAATSGHHRLAAHGVGVGSVVEDGQGPTPAGQLAGDGDVGDHGLLLAGHEGLPSLVQPVVTGVAASLRRRRGETPSAPHRRAWGTVVAWAIPCGLDEQSART